MQFKNGADTKNSTDEEGSKLNKKLQEKCLTLQWRTTKKDWRIKPKESTTEKTSSK